MLVYVCVICIYTYISIYKYKIAYYTKIYGRCCNICLWSNNRMTDLIIFITFKIYSTQTSKLTTAWGQCKAP